MIAVSIVSHGHGDMVEHLVGRLLHYSQVKRLVLTLNVPESLSLPTEERLTIIRNPSPKGFGANHNAAFGFCDQPFFCVLNPDVELAENPFPLLLEALSRHGASLIAPMVRTRSGEWEDNARHFPTVRSLMLKALFQERGCYPMDSGQDTSFPDWVAGMFMLFDSNDYDQLKGFDQGFHLYYEDVDICARTWASGMKVAACARVNVIHDARRDSRRNVAYLYWHLRSMIRYLRKYGSSLKRKDVMSGSDMIS